MGDVKVAYYKVRGRRPGARGYWTYSIRYIDGTLRNAGLMRDFAEGVSLPEAFGRGLGERCVEYPWVFARIPVGEAKILDAGSVFNYDFIVHQERLKNKSLTCVTLAPEVYCFYQERVSYLFEDLRSLPIRDDSFDVVISISTLEHIGLDNTRYTTDGSYRENDPESFVAAVKELNRVLKPGGRLLVTVPFGKYQACGWLQQFDLGMIRQLKDAFAGKTIEESYLRYTESGWNFTSAAACANDEYYDGLEKVPRFATARAVACLALEKPA
jgi:SAM-dependent methyltransferase